MPFVAHDDQFRVDTAKIETRCEDWDGNEFAKDRGYCKYLRHVSAQKVSAQ